MVLAVGEGLRWGHNNALASVDAQWVEVLHVADRDAVVVGIANNLVLNLFPSLEALLYQNLVRVGEGVLGSLDKLLAVGAEARTHAAQGVGCANYDGEANLLRCLQCLLYGVHGNGVRGLHIDALEHVGKDLSVLGVYDGLYGGAQHLDIIFF